MANRSKMKGYRGEVEVLTMVAEIVRDEYNRVGIPPPELARSPNGRDIRGIPWIALEVKYRETVQMEQWWTQTKENSPAGSEPVLIWRSNFQPWRVRMFGFLELPMRGTEQRPPRVRCPVDISVETWKVWFRERLRRELTRPAQVA